MAGLVRRAGRAVASAARVAVAPFQARVAAGAQAALEAARAAAALRAEELVEAAATPARTLERAAAARSTPRYC